MSEPPMEPEAYMLASRIILAKQNHKWDNELTMLLNRLVEKLSERDFAEADRSYNLMAKHIRGGRNERDANIYSPSSKPRFDNAGDCV